LTRWLPTRSSARTVKRSPTVQDSVMISGGSLRTFQNSVKKALIIAIALLWTLVSGGVSVPLTNGPNTITDPSASGIGSVIVRDVRNFNQSNADEDFRATNRGDAIQFWWINLVDGTTKIVLSRAPTKDGPWTAVLIDEFPDDLTPSGSIEYTDQELIPPDTANDYFYKLEAFSSTGALLKSYSPVFVPKFAGPSL